MLSRTLHISTSPHIRRGITTDQIMFNVVMALIPVVIFAIYSFGLDALFLLLVTVSSCVLTEHVLCRRSGQESTVSDWSAVITGVLLGLTLPPSFPLWMAFSGGVISIALGKFIFGGLGYNVFNPALVGRAFLQAAFPVAITTWSPAFDPDRFMGISSSSLALPFMEPTFDAMSGATPLAAFKWEQINTGTRELALGLISGSTGETCGILIIIGAIYLIIRQMMDWRIPASIFATVIAISGVLYLIDSEIYPSPVFMLFSGGLMLGALFMATDMVASPMTPLGVVLYGVLIGILIVVRTWGGLPEGVMYAILIANAVSPHIDQLVKPRVYGTTKKAQTA